MEKLNLKLGITGIILCVVCCIGNLSAQEKTTSEMLQAKVWDARIPKTAEYGYSIEVRYNDCEKISTMISGEKNYEIKSPYYLSDEISWTFDEQKVGQTKNGKYIIVNDNVKDSKEGPHYKEVMVYEILKLTETDLQLKNLKNNSFVPYKNKEEE